MKQVIVDICRHCQKPKIAHFQQTDWRGIVLTCRKVERSDKFGLPTFTHFEPMNNLELVEFHEKNPFFI